MAWFDTLSFGFSRRLPIVLQTEAAECGLACVAMVLGYHGVVTDLATLRQRHSVSMKGMTLAGLTRVTQQEKLGFRAVRLELGELSRLRLPAILHWDLNHFVVLREISRGKAVIHDPGFGERRLPLEEVSRQFTGVALELWPDPGFAPRKDVTPISIGQLVGQVRGLWPVLGQIMLLSLALEVVGLVSPLFMQWILDHVLVAQDASLLTTLAIGFLLLAVIQIGISTARSWVLLTMGTTLRVQWHSNVFAHLLRLPLDYFQKRHLGDIVSRTHAVDEIQRVLTTAFVASIFDGVLVIITFAMMLVYSPMLAGLAMIAVLIYLGLRILWYRPLYGATEEQIVRAANQSSHYLETIRGIRAIKLFGRQNQRRGAWQTLLVSETNAGLSIQKLRILYTVARSLLSGLFHVAILWAGATQIMAGQLSVGMLLAFVAYRGQFDGRISSLIDQIIDLKMLRLYAERLGDVVLTPAESDSSGLHNRVEGDATINASDLKFRYAQDEPWVLNGVNLSIRPGESVAIVGPSGCGKTTLVNLLLGILKPTEGTLQSGAVSLEQIGHANWRLGVGTVMQDDTLFAGSIADNINFFDGTPDVEWMQECARLACIETDIQSMPMAYQTLVGDMGTVLSGGQRQRILLARALYKKPRLLLLDEATSHLDIKREAEVNRGIASLNITRILVAHRPETIGSAQRVIALDGGRVSFDGDAAEYLRQMRLGLDP